MTKEQDEITLSQKSLERLLDMRGHLQMIMAWSSAGDLSDEGLGKMVRVYLKTVKTGITS
jgi:hypothetical protein